MPGCCALDLRQPLGTNPLPCHALMDSGAVQLIHSCLTHNSQLVAKRTPFVYAVDVMSALECKVHASFDQHLTLLSLQLKRCMCCRLVDTDCKWGLNRAGRPPDAFWERSTCNTVRKVPAADNRIRCGP